MMSKRAKILGLLVLGLVLWLLFHDFDALRGEELKFLLDRPWVDRLVESPRANSHVLFLLSRNQVGATIHGSSYRHLVNAVKHDAKDGRLGLTFLQDNITIRPRARTYECKGAPKGLDLCLEIDFRAKKLMLYSSSRWGRQDAPAHVRAALLLAESIESGDSDDRVSVEVGEGEADLPDGFDDLVRGDDARR